MWAPDTCDCLLRFSSGGNKVQDFEGFDKRCKIHQQATVQDIIQHNQSFNYKHGRGITISLAKREDINKDKLTERLRIRNL